MRDSKLKVFVFCWTNTRMVYRTPKGKNGLFYPVEKSIVIATSKKEAKAIFRAREEKFKATMRQQARGTRSATEIEKMLNKICYKSDLVVCEFLIEKGLAV